MLKLDFEKAYDTVSWDCLLEVLRLRGFGEKWIAWIKRRLSSAKVSVLLNGGTCKEIICKRGLR